MKKIILLLLLLIMILAVVPAQASALKVGSVVNINGMKATVVDFKNGQPVYQALISPNIMTTSSDGMLHIIQTGGLYATARNAASSGFKDDTGAWVFLANSLNAGNWIIARAFYYYDTSSLLGFVITAADLKMWGAVSGNDDTDSVQIQSGQPTYPHTPMVNADYDLSNYAGDGGSVAYSALPTSTDLFTIPMNAGGIAMINTSGITKLCLRSLNDINNVTPTGLNALWMTTSEQGAPYQPYMVVTFTALTPAVISVAASSIGATTARLNSTITDNGGDTTCQIEFGWGTVSRTAANYALYTTHTTVTVPKSDYTQGENPYLDVSGLVSGTPYFYRVKITNELASVVSTDEQTFTPPAVVDDMTSFIGYPASTSIKLNWGKSGGATNTLIRYKPDAFPATTADGTQVYFSSGETYNHTGLTDGTTYYYSAWGESGGTYSTNAINLVMTTSSELAVGGDITQPANPSGWFQTPDATLLVNLEPLYSIVNGLADGWGMPRGNAWFMLAMLFSLSIGLLLYIRFHAPALAMIAMSLLMMGFVVLHIMPSYIIGIVILLMLGSWGSRPQGV